MLAMALTVLLFLSLLRRLRDCRLAMSCCKAFDNVVALQAVRYTVCCASLALGSRTSCLQAAPPARASRCALASLFMASVPRHSAGLVYSAALSQGILVQLQQDDDEVAQLEALNQLNELLSISSEESLSIFPVEQLVPVLVSPHWRLPRGS